MLWGTSKRLCEQTSSFWEPAEVPGNAFSETLWQQRQKGAGGWSLLQHTKQVQY